MYTMAKVDTVFTILVSTGEKLHKPHPADAAAAAAAKPVVVRPASAVQSQRSLTSPTKAADVTRQGSKVADVSRQFSRAADLARQGSGGSDSSRQASRVSDIDRQGSYSPKKAGPSRTSSTAASVSSPPVQSPAISAAFARASQQAKSTALDPGAQQSTSMTLPPDSPLAPFAAADTQPLAARSFLAQPLFQEHLCPASIQLSHLLHLMRSSPGQQTSH